MRFSLDQQIEEIKREIALRERVYPGWVRSGKMRQSIADFHMDRLCAVLATLEALARKELEDDARQDRAVADAERGREGTGG